MKAIIVEDEQMSQQTLTNMVNQFCEDVEIVAIVDTVQLAVKEINKHKPDFIFLDIELPNQDGFQLFKYFEDPQFDVIFTTAYNEYALNAFKLSAIDYLLKPINLEELIHAISLVRKNINKKGALNKLKFLKENLGSNMKKIALPCSIGYTFVKIEDIIRCEASGSYTTFYLNNQKKIVVSKTLKVFSDFLIDFNFFKINRSNLINLDYLQSYERTKSPRVVLIDGTSLSLSLSRKEDFIKLLDNPLQ